jgi:hypothetical protein
MKNKVLIDCTNLVHSKVGGFENYLFNLLDSLKDRHGIEFFLFVLKSEKKHFDKYEGSFEIKAFDLRNKFIRLIWFNLILPLRCVKFDLLFLPANFRPIYIYTKTITVIHDLQYLKLPMNWNLLDFYFRKLFIPIAVNKSTTLIAISNNTKQEILENFRPTNLYVIYNPVKIIPQFNSEITFKTKKYFLVPSSLALHKNIFNLLKAVDSYEFLDYDFIFIGSYNQKDFPYKYSSPNIFVKGYVSENEKNNLFQNAFGVILPSIYEGFGMPYIEAILYKKNIIASDIGTAREILGNSAIFINQPYGIVEIKIAISNFFALSDNLITDSLYNEIKMKTEPYSIGSAYINLINKTIRNVQ